MRALPRTATIYVLAVTGIGLAVLLQAVSLLPADRHLLLEVALFIALAVLADLKHLELSYNASQSVATAINFACVVIFGAPVGTVTSAISSATTDLCKGKPLHKVAFNASAISLSVAAGGAVLEAINGPARGHPTPGHLPGFAAYALVNTVVNQVLVCTVIGLATRARPWEVAAANFRGVLLPIVALFPLGVLMAVIYVYFGHSLGLLLLAVPTVAVYDALNKAQQLRDHTRATLEVLADAVDRRDRYTAEHSQRVADYAGRIATVLGLSLDQRETIVSAAHVHDLGKVSIPDEVLRKPGNLNDEEWQLMRQHPVAGAEILAQLPMYREGAQLVGAHHERLDGRGYPLGLSGDDLPLGARVIAVADAYDAMTSDRPYRAALPVSVALARLREGAGTQFCPLVVDALAQALGEAQTLGERLAPVEPVASHASHVEPVSLGTAAMSRVSA